jgi:hypothetical protein
LLVHRDHEGRPMPKQHRRSRPVASRVGPAHRRRAGPGEAARDWDGNQGSLLLQIRPSRGPGGSTRTAQAPAATVNEFRTAQAYLLASIEP